MEREHKKSAAEQLITIGERLTLMRRAAAMTQQQASRETGIAQSVISDYENARKKLSVCDMLILCSAYGADPSELFSEKARRTDSEEADMKADDEEIYLSLAKKLVDELDTESADIARSYLTVCIYSLVRTLYKANPRHRTTRMFSLDDEQAYELLLKTARAMVPALSGRIGTNKSGASRLEISLDDAEDFRRLIAAAECEGQ